MRRALSGILLVALLAPSFPVLAEEAVAESLSAEAIVQIPPEEPPPPTSDPGSEEPPPPDPAEELLPTSDETSSSPSLSFLSVPATEQFTGVGQPIADIASDHLNSERTYLGQTGITFRAPGYVRHIVVYPDISDSDFMNCADSSQGNGTLNVLFSSDTAPGGGSGPRFNAAQKSLRDDGGCLYTSNEPVFVYPGASFNLTLNAGRGRSVNFEYLGTNETVPAGTGQASLSSSDGLTWDSTAASLKSLAFLMSTNEDAPPAFGAPEEAEYELPSSGITPQELANRVVLASGPEPVASGEGYALSSPLNIPLYFKEAGALRYLALPLGYFHDGADQEIYFYLDGRDCRTPAKRIFEWNIYNRARAQNWSDTIIGPFEGPDCFFDGTPPDRPWEGQLTVRASNTSINSSLIGQGKDGRLFFTAYSDVPINSVGCSNGSCASSILFLPGFLASRLYIGDRLVWEPNGDDDVRDLAMNADGTSAHPMLVGDVIDRIRINGLPAPLAGTVHEKLIAWMEQLEETGTIVEGRAFSYDWRYDVFDVIDDGVSRTDGSNEHLIPLVATMAAASRTGKLTIIAHSNGGLLAKALMVRLAETGNEDLIDRIVLVGSPQIGTPKSMLSLLHGYDILAPIVTLNGVTRASAITMPGAYGLLPTEEYFTRVQDPIAAFFDGDATAPYKDVLGETITTYAGMLSFAVNEPSTRETPAELDEETPYPLSVRLMEQAARTHEIIDAWEPPPTVEVEEIAGWGNPTIIGANYVSEKSWECSSGIFSCRLIDSIDFIPTFALDGDDTVLAPSARFLDRGVYFDLKESAESFDEYSNHQKLTETPKMLDYLAYLLGLQSTYALGLFVTDEPTKINSGLMLSVHSPVLISATDKFGNRTGLIPVSDGSIFYEQEDIPGSSIEFGAEGKYLVLPKEGEYEISFDGIGSGKFAVRIHELNDESVSLAAALTGLPVTADTTAHLRMTGDLSELSELRIDEDGDGEPEIRASFTLGKSSSFQIPTETPSESSISSTSHGGRITRKQSGTVLGTSTLAVFSPARNLASEHQSLEVASPLEHIDTTTTQGEQADSDTGVIQPMQKPETLWQRLSAILRMAWSWITELAQRLRTYTF